ncbi:MAG: hypothetical protein ACP5OH_05165 [Nitrososphaerota archaeon]
MAGPEFSIPIIGDVFDVITTWLFYSITKSKVSVIMNLAEFIPFVEDFLAVYTIKMEFTNKLSVYWTKIIFMLAYALLGN